MTGIDRLLSWFPPSWQARYRIEVRDLLDGQPVTWRVYRDLLLACADAWARHMADIACGVWPTVWGLAVTAVFVAAIASVGWVVALEVHAASMRVGFANWLQSQVGPSVSGWLAGNRDMLWIATGWFVFGWGWKMTPRIPSAMAIVCVLVTFSGLLALDPNGPKFIDSMCFGHLLACPFSSRLQSVVAWVMNLLTSPSSNTTAQE